MHLADSNIWLALALSKHKFHATVATWFAQQWRPKSLLFCRSTQQSFLRLITTQSVLDAFETPVLTNSTAWGTYERLLADERVAFAPEPRGLEAHWQKLAHGMKAMPKVWMDAYLAAFAIAGRFQMVTTDHGFNQFPGLDVLVL